MTTRWARFARGWVVAVFSTLIAALSHTIGGGFAPATLTVVVSLAFAGMICVGLAGHTLSAARLTVSVVLSQTIFHALFAFGGAGGALTAHVASAGTHGHLAPFRVSVLLAGLSGAADNGMAYVGHGGWMMLLAHLAAAAVTVLCLRSAERAFWTLLDNTRWIIRSCAALCMTRRVPVAVPAVLRCPPMTLGVPVERDLGVFLVARPRRGPPLGAMCV